MTLDDERLDSLIREDLNETAREWHAPTPSPGFENPPARRLPIPAFAAASIAFLAVLAMSATVYGLTAGYGKGSPLAALFGQKPTPTASASTVASTSPSPEFSQCPTPGTTVSSACSPSPTPCKASSCPPPCKTAASTTCPSPSPSPCPPRAAYNQPCSTPPPCGPTVTCVPAKSPPPGPGGCATLIVTTDAQSYPPGASVTITATLRNNSAQPCGVYVDNSGNSYLACNPSAEVLDPAGNPVWYSRNPMIMAPCAQGSQTTLGQGQSVSKTWVWDGKCGNGARCGPTSTLPGQYEARVRWDQSSASAYFRIT